MTENRIEEIRARAEAATPGHWGTYYDGKGTYTIEAQPRLIPGVGNVNQGAIATLAGQHGDGQTYHDARFAAHAREDVPFLLSRVAELEQAAPKALGRAGDDTDIRTYFGLSYANYLVLPRTLLQSMPEQWQHQFVALLEQMDNAFQHVPQAEAYEVTAGTEVTVSEMGHDLLEELGISEDWYDAPVPEDLGPSDLAEWRAEHEKSNPTYSRNGVEVEPNERFLVPETDPVPHYNRGRTRVEPRLDGVE